MAAAIDAGACQRRGGDYLLPGCIKELETPLQSFCYFFDSEIMNMIVEETIRSALTENIARQFKFS